MSYSPPCLSRTCFGRGVRGGLLCFIPETGSHQVFSFIKLIDTQPEQRLAKNNAQQTQHGKHCQRHIHGCKRGNNANENHGQKHDGHDNQETFIRCALVIK